MRNSKGITLIALVVTIIVLLILAGISIAILTGQNGIITRTYEAREENVKGKEREQISLAYTTEKSILLEKDSTEAVKAEDLESRLKSDGADVTSVVEEDGSLKVTFDTGNIYYVDENGTISEEIGEKPIQPPVLGEVEEPTKTTRRDLGQPCGVVEIAWLDLDNNVIAKPLSPNISNMNKVAWDASNNEVTPSLDSDWYDYNANKWANAKNSEDGSYFVWIPRYAYKIIYFDSEANKSAYIADNTSTAGISGYSTIYGITNSNGELVDGSQTNISARVQTTGYRDYIPHPGFLGTGNEDLGGGFGENSKGITGIWVAKFEMVREDSVDNGKTWRTADRTNGNVATKKAGASSYIRAVSKPGIASWREINIANSYENGYHYDRDKESHLMKNSEWGAVAYLAHSKYGRNGSEVSVNSSSSRCYTGGGTGDAYKTNTNQSTTGNTYGIYDMNGNAFEYVAAFNKAYNGDSYGSSYYSETGKMFASYNGASTKYATAYNNSTETEADDFQAGGVSRTGDALREVWVKEYLNWFEDASTFVNMRAPFLTRGGVFGTYYTGIFSSTTSIEGLDYGHGGYRIVLAK